MHLMINTYILCIEHTDAHNATYVECCISDCLLVLSVSLYLSLYVSVYAEAFYY